MSKRLICDCGNELLFPTQYCLYCGKKWAIGCGVFVSKSKMQIGIVGKKYNEILNLKRYVEEKSLRNLYEVAAEKIYDRRIEEIFVSGENYKLVDEAMEMFRKTFFPFKLVRTDTFKDFKAFFSKRESYLKTISQLKKVNLKPEDKIQGSHSTIIGEREGYQLLLRIATSPYVKKIVLGIIESSGTRSYGGLRFKVTRCDERGNIKGLLIHGSTVQQIYLITTASNKEEGEMILRTIRSS